MKPYWVLDRWGNQIDAIARPVQALPKDYLDGEDTLDLEVPGTSLAKGQRIVRLDRHGEWREYVVSQVEYRHEGGVLTEASCRDSRADLETDYLVEVEPGDVGAARALERALSSSTWQAGTVTVTGTATFSFYHMAASEAVEKIAEAFNAEVRSSITVSGTTVTGRRIDLLAHRGADHGALLTYGHNVTAVERVVSSDAVYTAMYGYGKSLETEGGGHSRKLTFGSVNGGRDWVGDDAALERYGVPDGHGGKRHAFGQVEFSECEDATELLSLTRQHLATVSKPTVSYTVTVAYLDADRIPDIGDTVHVRDQALGERLATRVIRLEGDDLNEGNTRVTLGTTRLTLTAKLKDTQRAADDAKSGVDDLNGRAPDWDKTTDTVEELPGEWLRKQMDRINQEMNAAKTYKFTSMEKGDIWANGTLTADGKPDGATAAIALNGLGFRISSRVQGGDFVWTTFGTGEGFTANVINVGTLRCGDNYLNLDTGELRIALTATVGSGGTSLSGYVQNVSNTAATNAKNQAIQQANSDTQEYLEDYVAIGSFDSYLTMQNTFNALTHNGRDKGFFIQSNQVFINADFVRTGIIISTNERSIWDLDNGYFETSSSGYSGGQFHNIYTRIAGGQYAVKMDQTDIGTVSTYSSGNVHPFGIKAFTDLVLSAPGSLGVGYTPTTQSGLTYTNVMRSGSVTYVESVSKSGDSISVTRRTLNVMQGMITGTSSIANATFSTPVIDAATLASSVEPASEIASGGAIPVKVVDCEASLMEAADESRMVWQVDPETLALGIPVYTGEEWTMGVPTMDPVDEPEDVTLPSTEYVDAQAALIQSEIEAVAASLGDAKLTHQLAVARTAMGSGSASALSLAAREVNSGGSSQSV